MPTVTIELSDAELEKIREIHDHLQDMGQRVGGWTSKSECRRTGLSLYMTFTKKVDVFETAKFQQLLEQAPAICTTLTEMLLGLPRSADAEAAET